MLSRNLGAITSPSNRVHQRRDRSYARVKRHCGIIQHQIDRGVPHPILAGQGPLNERLACRTGHPRNRNGGAHRRGRRHFSRSTFSALDLHCIRHSAPPYAFSICAEKPMRLTAAAISSTLTRFGSKVIFAEPTPTDLTSTPLTPSSAAVTRRTQPPQCIPSIDNVSVFAMIFLLH